MKVLVFRALLILALPIFAGAGNSLALDIGDAAPGFTLPGADGKAVSLSDFKDKIVVLEWMNPGCPYVRKHYSTGHMQLLQEQNTKKDIVWLTINSTSPDHGDFIEAGKRTEFVSAQHMASTAYLSDETGAAGKSYGAKTTPHMFVIDKAGKLAYRGAIDDAPMGDPAEAKNYVVKALEEVSAGKPASEPDTKSYGCSVKY